MLMSNADKQLLQRLNELKKERQPERDLWRGIELGLARYDEQVMGSSAIEQMSLSLKNVATLLLFTLR